MPRYAMEVDDHALSWGDFEGVIPKGRYGADEEADGGDPVAERPESVVSGRTIEELSG